MKIGSARAIKYLGAYLNSYRYVAHFLADLGENQYKDIHLMLLRTYEFRENLCSKIHAFKVCVISCPYFPHSHPFRWKCGTEDVHKTVLSECEIMKISSEGRTFHMRVNEITFTSAQNDFTWFMNVINNYKALNVVIYTNVLYQRFYKNVPKTTVSFSHVIAFKWVLVGW